MVGKRPKRLFWKCYTKTIYGIYEVEAESPDEADKMFKEGKFIKTDNDKDMAIDNYWSGS